MENYTLFLRRQKSILYAYGYIATSITKNHIISSQHSLITKVQIPTQLTKNEVLQRAASREEEIQNVC